MGFGGLQIPDSSWIVDPRNRIQSLPGAALSGFQEGKTMQDLFNQYKLRDIETQKAQRGQNVTSAMDELNKSFPNTPAGQQEVAKGLAERGFGQEALTQSRWAQDWEQHNKEYREKDKQAMKERGAASARLIKKMPLEDRPKAWEQMKKELQEDGYDITDVPPAPTPEVLDVLEKSLMSQKELEDVRQGDESAAELKRWHDMQLKMSKNKNSGLTTAWTDEGLVIVDKPGATVTPTTGGTGPGGIAQAKPPQTPVQVNMAIAKNTAGIGKMQTALQQIEAYKKGTGLIKGLANSTSAGSTILNKYDPKGVQARASVADIGSILLHDRTGAAATISETPRLVPFIPLTTDDYATAKKKITRLLEIAQEENLILQQTYPGAGPKGGGGGGASGSWGTPPGTLPPPAERIWSRVPPKK